MKIGYYFPREGEISKSLSAGNSLIEWESDLGCDFILSLFTKKNLDLPLYNKNHDFSFSSLEDLEEYMSLVKSIIAIEKIEYKIIADYPDNIIPSLKKLKYLHKNNLLLKEQINELIESFGDNLKSIQKNLKEPLAQKAEKLANLNEGKLYTYLTLQHSFTNILGNYEQLEIPVFGFKMSDSLYSNFEFNELIGYNHEERYTLYNQFDCLNKIYKVIRTDNRDDVLWIMLARSTRDGNRGIKLAFRSKSIKKLTPYHHDKSEILNSKNDYVFFFKFTEKENTFFLIASDKPVSTKSINSESEKVSFGVMEVLDSDGNYLDVENSKRIGITKTLRRGDILEGFKLNNKKGHSYLKKGNKIIELYSIVTGNCDDICNVCCKAPCICEYIINWEERFTYFRDDDFSIDDSPIDDEAAFSPYLLKDNFGLNWNSYNDQLDMDQQDPEFWG
jgi:hypothetical protein